MQNSPYSLHITPSLVGHQDMVYINQSKKIHLTAITIMIPIVRWIV